MINDSYQNIISPEAIDIRVHVVDTLTGLLIGLIYHFDIMNIIKYDFRDV